MNSHEPNEILMCAVDTIENLSTLGELDFPRIRQEQEVGMLECVFRKEKVKTNATDNGTRVIMTEMADDTKMRSELF